MVAKGVVALSLVTIVACGGGEKTFADLTDDQIEEALPEGVSHLSNGEYLGVPNAVNAVSYQLRPTGAPDDRLGLLVVAYGDLDDATSAFESPIPGKGITLLLGPIITAVETEGGTLSGHRVRCFIARVEATHPDDATHRRECSIREDVYIVTSARGAQSDTEFPPIEDDLPIFQLGLDLLSIANE